MAPRAAVVALVALLALGASVPARAAGEVSVVHALTAAGDFSNFLSLLATDAELYEDLSKPGYSVTVFAPTDEAFAIVLNDTRTVEEYFEGPQGSLAPLVAKFHVVAGNVTFNSTTTELDLTTFLGSSEKLPIFYDQDYSEHVIVTDNTIAGIEAWHGVKPTGAVLYEIDSVLIPSAVYDELHLADE